MFGLERGRVVHLDVGIHVADVAVDDQVHVNYVSYLTLTNMTEVIVVSIPACHAGDRGSIPRRGAMLLLGSLWLSNHWSFTVNQLIRKIT